VENFTPRSQRPGVELFVKARQYFETEKVAILHCYLFPESPQVRLSRDYLENVDSEIRRFERIVELDGGTIRVQRVLLILQVLLTGYVLKRPVLLALLFTTVPSHQSPNASQRVAWACPSYHPRTSIVTVRRNVMRLHIRMWSRVISVSGRNSADVGRTLERTDAIEICTIKAQNTSLGLFLLKRETGSG
jgi:hypothetical protein